MVDLEDLPESLQLKEHHDYDAQLTFKFYDKNPEHEIIHMQWAWVMGEMIWAFDQIKNDGNDDQFYKHPKNTKGMSVKEQIELTEIDEEGLKKHHDRISNGLRLFGKYYRNLWD